MTRVDEMKCAYSSCDGTISWNAARNGFGECLRMAASKNYGIADFKSPELGGDPHNKGEK